MTEWTCALNALQELLGIICPECTEEFEANPLAVQYRWPLYGAGFYPGEN